MAKKQVRVMNSAPARGAYSQAICAGDFVYVTGTAPVNPETGTITTTTVAGQTEQVIDNIEAALTAAAGGLGDVVKSTMHLLDTETLAEIDECMVPTPYPVRTTLGGDMRRAAAWSARVCSPSRGWTRWMDGQRRLIGPWSAVSAASFPTSTSARRRFTLTTAPS